MRDTMQTLIEARGNRWLASIVSSWVPRVVRRYRKLHARVTSPEPDYNKCDETKSDQGRCNSKAEQAPRVSLAHAQS